MDFLLSPTLGSIVGGTDTCLLLAENPEPTVAMIG